MNKLTMVVCLAAAAMLSLGGCASFRNYMQSENAMGAHPELDQQVREANTELKSRNGQPVDGSKE